MVRVHYTGFAKSYDEWIDINSHRLQKQWRQGMEFKLNNRLDIRDIQGNWLEGHIVAFVNHDKSQIKVHFKGFTAKWDETINLNTDGYKIKEVGAFSKGHGWAKYDN